jgi:hypothetical protein
LLIITKRRHFLGCFVGIKGFLSQSPLIHVLQWKHTQGVKLGTVMYFHYCQNSTKNLRIEMSREPLVLPNAPNQSLIQIISQDLTTLNKTQAKVARTILANPKSATQSSIANLAKKSAVSEPSVNRFCK